MIDLLNNRAKTNDSSNSGVIATHLSGARNLWVLQGLFRAQERNLAPRDDREEYASHLFRGGHAHEAKDFS